MLRAYAKQVLRQVESMGFDIEAMAPPLIRDLLQILDRNTRFEWEKQQRTREPKPISELLSFLEHHANCMLLAQPLSSNRRGEQQLTIPSKRAKTVVGHVSEAVPSQSDQPAEMVSGPTGCPICKGQCVNVERCREFMEFGPYKRQKVARKTNICFGCLKSNHNVNDCKVAVCPHCTSGRKHHRLLCFAYHAQCHPREPTNQAVGLVRQVSITEQGMAINTVAQKRSSNRPLSFPPPPGQEPIMSIDQLEFERQEHPLAQIVMANQVCGALLATAIIRVRAINGEFKVLRALCDTGAQTNLITEKAVQLLAAVKTQSNESLCPVGTAESLPTKGTVQLVLAPLSDNSQLFRIQIKAFVLKRVTSQLPVSPLEIGTWPPSINKSLADPTAAEPGPIDVLLGAHVWSLIQRQGFFNNL